MKYLNDFLQNNKNSEIFELLACNDDEIKILTKMLDNYLMGINSSSSLELINALFKDDKNKFDKLKNIQSLLKKELIETAFPFMKESAKSSLLSLLSADLNLSDDFFLALEGEYETFILPQAKPYLRNSEYLQDQFLRISLYQKRLRLNSQKEKFDENIKDLEEIIKKRIELSKISLPCEKIFKDFKLSESEIIIFLNLLKEDYSNSNDNFRDLNYLLRLISHNEIENVQARSLLSDDGILIKNDLIDYGELILNGGLIGRRFYINDEILHEIMHPNKKVKSNKLELENIIKKSEIFELITPKNELKDIILDESIKETLNNSLRQLDKKALERLHKWNIKKSKSLDLKVVFYGPPGTGKTVTALAFAKALKKQVLNFDCSKILSKYVGESEQNVRKIFDTYNEIKEKTKFEPVLLLNEADQFLSARLETSSGAEKMHNQMQNIFLEQIENFQGVLIATTNFLESLDPAFSRRFDKKIEFKKPDFDKRLKIWEKVLPKNAQYEDNFDIKKLANYELTGAQIELMTKNTAIKAAVSEDGVFRLEDFLTEIKRELKSAFDRSKKVGLL